MNREFSCSDKETLIAYVYDECDPDERHAVEAHLASCRSCADELAGFGGVRQVLAAWQPPAAAGSYRLVREESLPARAAGATAAILRPARWWQRPLSALARAAAALLLVAGGAALANLDVRYGADGLTIRTGWQHQAPAAQSPASPVAEGAAVAPWRTDLAALERQLRGDFSGQLQAVRAGASQLASAGGADERQMMSRVRAMIDESEQRQQRELAYRLTQVQGEFGVQRRADQLRMLQSLGQLQGQTSTEVAQQRQLINYLLTVSQKK